MVSILTALGTGVGGNLLTRALDRLGDTALGGTWDSEDDLGRLFRLMEFAFAEELPGLDYATLKSKWANDEAFLAVYRDLVAGADPTDEQATLVAAIEPLVVATEEMTAKEVATLLAGRLPHMLPWALEPADRVLLAVERGRNEIEGVAQTLQAVQADVQTVGSDVRGLGDRLDRIEALLPSPAQSGGGPSAPKGRAAPRKAAPGAAGPPEALPASDASEADPWPLKPATRAVIADTRRVVPFVGAGVTAKTGMPLGAGLARLLRTDHPLAQGAAFAEPDNLISVSGELAARAPDGREQVAQFIIDLLDIDKHGYLPTPAIRNLVHTPSRWYLTTTYDLLAERAAEDAGIEYESFTWQQLPPQEHIDRDIAHKLYIVHLHGSVEEPDSLILDGSSYRNIANQGEVRQFLEALFHEFRVCFMGTSLDEQYLQAYLLSWRGTTVRHVLVDDENGIRSATQGRGAILGGLHGVGTEAFPAGQWDLLDAFTRNLVTRPASSATPLVVDAPAAPVQTGLVLPQDAVASVLPAVRYLRSDWGPAWTRRALDDLGRHREDEAFQLQTVLRDSADPAVVRELIEHPADWMAQGSVWLWTAVARFAEQQGDWALASVAWQRAADRPDADKAACLVAASVASEIAGDEEARKRLLDSARAVDPDHPRVRLQDVDLDGDVESQLAQLEPLWEVDGDVAAIAHAQAAIVNLLSGDLDAAEGHLNGARRINPELMQTRIVAQNIVIHRNRLALAAGERVDARAVAAAKDECLALREELMAMGRWNESVRLLMLAADAATLQWEREEAGRLLLTAAEEEKNARSGRIVLADAALRAQQYTVALALLEGVPPSEDTVARATAQFHLGDEAEKRAAFAVLDQAVSSNGREALSAAMVRLTRAAELPSAGWSDEAERVLEEGGMGEAALASKAMWLHATGDGLAARRLLQPHAQNIRIVEMLLGLAVLDDDEQEAARLAGDLLALGPDNFTRLRCADTLYRAGDVGRAKSEAAVVADDPTASPLEQAGALFLLAGIAADNERDYTEALSLFERWAEVEPDNERHVWGRVLSLTRLTRHAEALNLLEDTHVFPVTLHDAHLAASVYARMSDPVEALRRIRDLIDRAPERDIELERQLQLVGLMRSSGVELPEDVAARLRPQDVQGAGLRTTSLDALREQGLRSQASQQDVLDGIEAGETPTMTLAAIAGSNIGAVWMRLSSRPYGFGFTPVDALEVRDAELALRRGLIVEPTALFTLGDLGGEAGEKATAAVLAGGRVTQAALDDLDAGVVSQLPELTTMARQELVFDPATAQPVSVPWPPELVEADHRRAHRMLELAQGLAVERDPVADDRGDLPALFKLDAPTPLRVLISTPVAAQRTGLAVYSDDRNVRLLLRDVGIPVFGTAALLQALRQSGALSADGLWAARTRLRASGYVGVVPDDAELMAAVDAASGDCSEALRLAFYDRGVWKGEYGSQLRRAVGLLHYVFTQYPQHFPAWMARVLAAALDCAALHRTVEGPPATLRESLQFHAEWLLVATWAAVRMDDPTAGPFLQAVRTQLDAAARDLGASIDPLMGATHQYEQMRVHIGAVAVPGLPLGLLARMPIGDVMRLLGVDPRRPSPPRLPSFPRGPSPAVASLIAHINQQTGNNPRQSPRRRR